MYALAPRGAAGLDRGALAEHVEHLVSPAPVALAVSSWMEPWALSSQERRACIETVTSLAGRRCPVVVDVTCDAIGDAVALAEIAIGAGADLCYLAAPHEWSSSVALAEDWIELVAGRIQAPTVVGWVTTAGDRLDAERLAGLPGVTGVVPALEMTGPRTWDGHPVPDIVSQLLESPAWRPFSDPGVAGEEEAAALSVLCAAITPPPGRPARWGSDVAVVKWLSSWRGSAVGDPLPPAPALEPAQERTLAARVSALSGPLGLT
ncbi:dihydrodipicolinate synthase family protein [Dactylosporangium sp. NPDC000555]|uniref:dihydrodipicolinate synthase family protein n=1 Tax=Dactylosporangium sp. NPDC000555 TaxID=3154260 RepID=UPI003319A5C7